MADHAREMQELAEVVAAWRAIPEDDRRTTMLEGAGDGWIAENMRILAGIAEFGAPDEPLEEARWGELEIGAALTSDDLGEVWSARTAGGKEVRLRLFRSIQGDPTRARTDVVQEATALAGLRHPAVVPVRRVAAYGGRLGVWSDRVEGDSLAEDAQLWEPARVAASLAALAMALEACRAAGLTGRDISPARLAVQGGAVVLVEPFGRGPRPEGDDPVEDGWKTASPEVWRGGGGDARSDVWSLGAFAVHRLTGCWPVSEGTAATALAGHQQARDTEVPAGVPAPVRAVLRRALLADPSRRWENPARFAAAFAEAADRPVASGLLGWLRDLFS